MKKALSYDQVSLVPRRLSTIGSRATDVDTSVNFCDIKLDIPMIASPMPDVCNGHMANELAKLGAMGIIHRFQSINEQCHQFSLVENKNLTGCAIGIGDDYQNRFHKLYEIGCSLFTFDTANGYNIRLEKPIKYIKEYNVKIIAGNVASGEGYKWLADLGVDAVRVSIATGEVCETRTETGVYVPIFSCIEEIAQTKHIHKLHSYIIADGGVKIPAHLCKAIAIGADVIMAGGLFSGCKESPSSTLKVDGKLYKILRGAASFSVQQDVGKTPQFVEGRETLVAYQGSVEKVISRFKNGLMSSMSYMNARNLDEFKKNAFFVEID